MICSSVTEGRRKGQHIQPQGRAEDGKVSWEGGSAALCDGSTSKGKTFFRKTTFFFRSRDPFKKHGAEILCRTALVSRKIDLRRPHSWPKEFVHFCPNLGSGGEHLKWARPQTNCGQEKINAWAYPWRVHWTYPDPTAADLTSIVMAAVLSHFGLW